MDQLITKAIQGDIDAFDQLLQLEKPRLLAKAFKLTGNRTDAEDIVQESIIKAFESVHQLRQPHYFSTWLFRILIHESYAFFKKRERSLGIEVKLRNNAVVTARPDLSSFDSLYEALSSLKDEYRTAIVLHYFYDFSIREISSMLDKPKNTVKTYLFRGRRELKQQLQQKLNLSITSKEMASMLKEDLSKLAISFVEVPKHLELVVEDYQSDRATYIWANNNLDDGASVTLDSNGRLIVLNKIPSNKQEGKVSFQDQQNIAEQFLVAQHSEALSYLKLTSFIEKKEGTLFLYGQLVGGILLGKFQTSIEVSDNGEVISFYYKGYTKTPPSMPDTFIEKNKVLDQIVRKETWQLKSYYLSKDTYNVEKSGVFKLYTNSSLSRLFNAHTGKPNYLEDEYDAEVTTIPISNVQPMKMSKSIKEIVGIPDLMVLKREQETDNEFWQVWGDEEENDTSDRSFEGFFRNQTENTVKLKMDKETKRLKEFVWFKRREGNLQLSYEQCKQVACAFIATYFAKFLPYVHLQVEEPSFNNSNRAFFRFPLHDRSGMPIEGESFYISVNRTTGLIDMCNGPDIPIECLEVDCNQPVLPIEELQQAFGKIDACLTWSVNYEAEEPFEELKYMVCQADSMRRIVGINAITGELITYQF